MRNTIGERYIMLWWCLNRPPDVFSLDSTASEMVEQVNVRALENVQIPF